MITCLLLLFVLGYYTIVAGECLHDTPGEQFPLPVVLHPDHEGHGLVLVPVPVSYSSGHVEADPALGAAVLHHGVEHDLGGGADARVAELEPEHRDPQLGVPAPAELVKTKLGSIHLDLGARPIGREADFIEENVHLWILRTLQKQPIFASGVTYRLSSQDG